MPIPRSPPSANEKWQTVRSALDSWSRTLRLCLICLFLNVPVDVLVVWLLRRLSLLWVPSTYLGTYNEPRKGAPTGSRRTDFFYIPSTGRGTALILVSQNAGDLLNEQVTNCLSRVFASGRPSAVRLSRQGHQAGRVVANQRRHVGALQVAGQFGGQDAHACEADRSG